MKRKVLYIFLMMIVVGSPMQTFCQEEKAKSIIIKKSELGEDRYNWGILQDQQYRYEEPDNRRFWKKPKFWVLLAGIGGMTAGIVLASTADNKQHALPVPYSAMGPVKKNR